MANGAHPPNGDSNFTRQLAAWHPGLVVSPEVYNNNRAKINQMREALNNFEQQNERGFQQYAEQQRLLERIEAGREAERQLAQMMQGNSSATTVSSVPNSGPSYSTGHASTFASGSGVHNQVPSASAPSFQANPLQPQRQPYYQGNVPHQQPSGYPTHQTAQGGPSAPSQNYAYGEHQNWAANGGVLQQPPASASSSQPFSQQVPTNINGQVPPQTRYFQQHSMSGSTSQSSSTRPQTESMNASGSAPTVSQQHPPPAAPHRSAAQPSSSATNNLSPELRASIQEILSYLKQLKPPLVREIVRLVNQHFQRVLFPNGAPAGVFDSHLFDTSTDENKRVFIRVAGEISGRLSQLPLDILQKTLLHINTVIRREAAQTPAGPAAGTAGIPTNPGSAATSSSRSEPPVAAASTATSNGAIRLTNPAATESAGPSASTGRVASTSSNVVVQPQVPQPQASQPQTSSHPLPVSQPNGSTQTFSTNNPVLSAGLPTPPSKRTPAMADRSRLARDILRSLGGTSQSPSAALHSSSSGSGTGTSDPKGKRKAVDLEPPVIAKHPRLSEPRDSQPLPSNHTQPLAPASSSSIPLPTPHPNQMFPVIPPTISSPIAQTPIVEVSQEPEGVPSGDHLISMERESVATEDTRSEQVDQLVDEDIEEYPEIKTPGAIQLEVETLDDMLVDKAATQDTALALDPGASHIGADLTQVPSSPEYDMDPAGFSVSGPPSSHVSTSPQEPPPSEHFDTIGPFQESSEIEQILSQPQGTISPQPPTSPAPFDFGVDHPFISDVHPKLPTGPTGVENGLQTEAGPSKLPLFLPSDSDVESDDIILLSSHAKRRASGTATIADQHNDVFVLDSNLLAGPELPSYSRGSRSRSQAKTSPSRVSGSRCSLGRQTQKMLAVEVPPLPSWAKRIKAREAKRAGKQKARSESVVPATPDRGSIITDDNELVSGADHEDDEEARENQEIEQRSSADSSYRRLRESRCQWANCNGVLNCAERLATHASTHAKEKDVLTGFSCEWDGCHQTFHNAPRLSQHLRSHALFPLHCAFEGCEVSCPSSNELARHHRLPRHVGDTFRPTIAPVQPKLSSIPLPELGVRPIWMLDTPLVKQPAISSQLHQWLAPRVSDKIRSVFRDATHTKISTRNSAARRLSEKIPVVEQKIEQDPEFLSGRPQRPQDRYAAWKTPSRRRGPKLCSDFPVEELNALLNSGYVVEALSETEADAALMQAYRGEAEMGEELEPHSDGEDMYVDVVGEAPPSLPSTSQADGDDTSDGEPPVFVEGSSSAERRVVVDGSDKGKGKAGDEFLGSPVVRGGERSTHQSDGDQATRQQPVGTNQESSLPTWTVLPQSDGNDK